MTEGLIPLVRRGRRNAGYTAISNALVDHPTLGPEARIALIYLLTKPDDWQLQINDMRRLLGTGGKPCGRNKAYEVIKELKSSSYVLAHEELRKGRFYRLTYYVFDEPLLDPDSFRAELRASCHGDVQAAVGGVLSEDAGVANSPCPETRETVGSPCPEIRETVAPPHPHSPHPEKRDSTKDRKKQITEIPLQSPVDGATAEGEGAGKDFKSFWAEWPEAERPRERGIAEGLFDRLSEADQACAQKYASRYRLVQSKHGVGPRMIPYLRNAEFKEFVGAPEFTSDGYFRIKPTSPEWRAWEAHLRPSIRDDRWATQEALGFLLCRSRWPDGQDGGRPTPKRREEKQVPSDRWASRTGVSS